MDISGSCFENERIDIDNRRIEVENRELTFRISGSRSDDLRTYSDYGYIGDENGRTGDEIESGGFDESTTSIPTSSGLVESRFRIDDIDEERDTWI